MSLRNYLKKFGRRAAGTWGRINHKRDMRAESKAIRKHYAAIRQHDIEEYYATIKQIRELKNEDS